MKIYNFFLTKALLFLILLISDHVFAQQNPSIYTAPNGFRFEIYSNDQTRNSIPLEKSNSSPGEIEISHQLPDQETYFPWIPNGENGKPVAYACTQEGLYDSIWKNGNFSTQTQNLQKWTNQCHATNVKLWQKIGLFSSLKFSTIYYPIKYNPYVRFVKIKLPDGRWLAGFLALKPGQETRPFVIAKCGVFCAADNGVLHRNFLMHLFDESPFNLLTLANISGSDFQIDNKSMSLGGFDEGRQIYQIGEFLKSRYSPVSQLISSLHIVGGSLGGHGVLYASLYASLNPAQQEVLTPAHQGKALFDSSIAMCPVVVLENSANRLFTKGPVSTAASQITLNHFRNLLPYVPIIGQFIEISKKANKQLLYRGLTRAIVEYYRTFTAQQNWELLPFQKQRIEDLKTFWTVNNFINYQSQVTIPTLVIAADDDGLVRSKENADLLTPGIAKNPEAAVQYLHLRDGGHCSFSLANGWSNFSEILRSFILSHSPEITAQGKTISLDISQNLFTQNRPVRDFAFVPSETEGFLNLRLIYGKRYSPSTTCLDCNDQTVSLIPIRELPFETTEILNKKFYLNQLARYANTRFRLLDENHISIRKSHKNPKYIFWIQYP